jgi:hypothetical protein
MKELEERGVDENGGSLSRMQRSGSPRTPLGQSDEALPSHPSIGKAHGKQCEANNESVSNNGYRTPRVRGIQLEEAREHIVRCARLFMPEISPVCERSCV